MKRYLTIIIASVLVAQVAVAQRALRIQRTNGVTDYAPVSRIDALTFSEDLSHVYIYSGTSVVTIDRDDITELTYAEAPTSLLVTYDGSAATVENPFLLDGVTATTDGAHVSVTNTDTISEREFTLTGTTDNGSFLYTAAYKSTIVLDGVSITNPTGPAIDIACGKRIALQLKKGTVSHLTDGEGGDWKAALYCKGHLEIDKAGTLNVTGRTKHAISAGEYIQLKKSDGIINILSAVNDGIHCKQYFLANGYSLTIQGVGGDGIQAERSGDDPYEEDLADGSLWIQGGTFHIHCTAADAAGMQADTDLHVNNVKSEPVINIVMSGDGSKGMKASGTVDIAAGNITISNEGATLTEGTDTQSAKCISADTSVSITAGSLTLATTGAGGKCIKSDDSISIGDADTHTGPTLTASTTGGTTTTASGVSLLGGGGGGGGGFPGWRPGETTSTGSSAKAIKAMGAIHIYGGQLEVTTLSSGAEGIESKQSINISGGTHYLRCYDDGINSSGPIVFDGGITICHSTGNDAVDSNYGKAGAIVIGDGVVLAYTTKGGAEMGFDCDSNSYIQITGKGTGISAGGSMGNSATLSTAAQGYAFVTTSISYQTGRYYTLADAEGKNLVTYCLDSNVTSQSSMFTADGMQKGSSYTLKWGTEAPTDASTSFHGIYLGSSLTGTTSVTSFTAK